MSLIAWYPLNGNTNDYSGNNIIASTATAPNYTDFGKIGKALTTGSLELPAGLLNSNLQSISMWYYNTEASSSTTGSHQLTGGDPRRYALFAFPNNDDLHYSFYDDITQSNAISGVISDALPNLKWTHICLINNNGNFSIYINGNLSGTFSRLNWVRNFNNSIYSLVHSSNYHRINDVRIYDHALSEKEIKEIAKAKILHYTFDDFQEPTTNLVPSIVTALYDSWGINAGTSTIFIAPNNRNGVYLNITSFTDGGVGWYTSGGQFNAVASTKYTVSAIIKSSVAFSPNLFYIRQYNSGGTQVSEYGIYNSSYIIALGDEWYKAYNTFTTTVDCAKFLVQGYQYSLGQFWIYDLQVEKKDYSTDFILPLSSRGGIINDQSGFRNNATLTEATTPRWISDSKIGSGAYRFNATSSSITIPKFNLMDGIKEFSVGFWIKLNSYQTSSVPIGFFKEYLTMYTFDDGSPTNCLGFRCIINGSWASPVDTGVLSLNTYYHVFTTYSPISGFKLYLNGVLKSQSSTVGTISIGNEAYGNTIGCLHTGALQRHIDGWLDDIRIYGETLSDSDILELYQTRASVDSSGNLYTSQLKITPFTKNLLHWWKLDGNGEASTGSINGTISGAIAVVGKINTALSFNGTSYMLLSSNLYTNPITNWSVSAWVKCSSTGVCCVLSNSSGGPVGSLLGVDAGKITYWHYNGAWYYEYGTSIISDNNWHFLSWANNGNSTIGLYVDGKLENIVSSASQNVPVNQIGKYWSTGAAITIDDLKWFDKTLNIREINILYNTGGY